MIHLDTHVVLWLYAGQVERLPAGVQEGLRCGPLAVSPMVVLELQYLHETGRIAEPAAVVMGDLRARAGLRVAATPFERVAEVALGLTWTRDPFDRLIAAQAQAEDATLFTADRTLRQHLPHAVWD